MTSTHTEFVRSLSNDPGYCVSLTKKNHVKVSLSPERRSWLQDNGFDVDAAPAFVIIPSTPSDHRSEKNSVRDLRRIGYGWAPPSSAVVSSTPSPAPARASHTKPILDLLREVGPKGATTAEIFRLLPDIPRHRITEVLRRKQAQREVIAGDTSRSPRWYLRDAVTVDALVAQPETVETMSAPENPETPTGIPAGQAEPQPPAKEHAKDLHDLVEMILDLPLRVLVDPECDEPLRALKKALFE